MSSVEAQNEEEKKKDEEKKKLYADKILPAVTKLSENEDYEDFITRSLANEIGKKVKMADLRHNMDVSRIDKVGERDIDRLNRYQLAYARILDQL